MVRSSRSAGRDRALPSAERGHWESPGFAGTRSPRSGPGRFDCSSDPRRPAPPVWARCPVEYRTTKREEPGFHRDGQQNAQEEPGRQPRTGPEAGAPLFAYWTQRARSKFTRSRGGSHGTSPGVGGTSAVCPFRGRPRHLAEILPAPVAARVRPRPRGARSLPGHMSNGRKIF
jgi:hypothetical protein